MCAVLTCPRPSTGWIIMLFILSWWNEGFLWHFLYYWRNGLRCQLPVYGGTDMILNFSHLSPASAKVELCLHFCVVNKVQSVNTGCSVSHVGISIFLYADDILLLAPSVNSCLLAKRNCIFWTCVSMIKSRLVYILVTGMMCVVHQ